MEVSRGNPGLLESGGGGGGEVRFADLSHFS